METNALRSDWSLLGQTFPDLCSRYESLSRLHIHCLEADNDNKEANDELHLAHKLESPTTILDTPPCPYYFLLTLAIAKHLAGEW